MRVGSVSCVCYPTCRKVASKKQQPVQKNEYFEKNVNFNGKFGQIIGGTLGAGAVLVASFIAAPATVCLTGAGLVLGILGGDIAEDKINKNSDSKKGQK